MINKLKLITTLSFSSVLMLGSMNAQEAVKTTEMVEKSDDLRLTDSFFSGMTFTLENGKFKDTPLKKAEHYILYFSASW